MRYRAEIDGLRALAVVPVLFFHAGFTIFSGGFVGVDVFFVISGYLIATLLLEDIENNRFSIVNFYERRARRILPALYLVTLITLIGASIFLLPQPLLSTAKSAFSIPFFFSNFFFWSERGYFGTATELKPLIHTWSLAVEEQFYIVFPLFLLGVTKFKKALLHPFLILVFLSSLVASYYLTQIHFATAFYFPLTRAWELLIGVFCAIALKKGFKSPNPTLGDAVSGLGLAFIIAAYMLFDENTLFPYIWALVPTLGTAMFILFASDGHLVKFIIGSRLLVFLGLISYSLYLWHQPIFALARSSSTFENYEIYFIGLSLGVAVLTYYFVEQPFRRKATISTKTLWFSASLVSVIIISTSAWIISTKGLPVRFPEHDRPLLKQLAAHLDQYQSRFDKLQNTQFDPTLSTKILMVGDSHARDFMYIVDQSQMFQNHSFSTRQINSECGNLYLKDYSDIQINIPVKRRTQCELMGRYDGDSFRMLIQEADEIWLVNAWRKWVINLLPLSLENISRDFGKPVKVIGLKDFGHISQNTLLGIPHGERPGYKQPVKKSASEISDHLDSTLHAYEHYYSVMDPICGFERTQCSIFTVDGLLVTTDGQHLTQAGALEVSRRIKSVLERLRGF